VLDTAYRLATGMPLSAIRDFADLQRSVNVISHAGGHWRSSPGRRQHLPQELAMDDS